MRVGLFFDYDGVLAPIVPEPFGLPSKEIVDVLVSLKKNLNDNLGIAVITTRDCQFMFRVLPIFDGYACIHGLEIHGGGYIAFDKAIYSDKPKTLEKIEAIAREVLGKTANLYLLRTWNNIPISLIITWKPEGKPAGLEQVLKEAISNDLSVSNIVHHGSYYDFIEVRIAKRSKDKALRILKTLLDLDNVVYFGDSQSDIPAFKEADISIFIRHEFNRELGINADYEVEISQLASWLTCHINELLS